MPPTKRITFSPLTPASFAQFGTFVNMLDPIGANTFGQPPIEFIPDILELDTAGKNPSFSLCQVTARPLVVDTTEFHTSCGEGILPLDSDIIVHVGSPTPDDKPPLDQIKAFLIRRGTLVTLRPGVWHHAPFSAFNDPVNIMIVLPGRTYTNDCTVVQLAEDDQIEIMGIP